MDDLRVGLMVRAVRLRRGLRQADLAAAAGTSRQTISRLERGELAAMCIRTLRRVSRALGMPPMVTLGWRGADVAELLDEGHARVVDGVVAVLQTSGWEIAVEYSFNHFGERGSVDVLAWHAATRSLLIVEAKTRIVDLQDLFSSVDRKKRLVPRLVAAERGWAARGLGVVLVVPEMSALRRAVARHSASFDTAFQQRTVEIRRWIRSPRGSLSGVWFLADSHGV
jgi:transcriptional regulator with XRE-family HTH domain